MTTIQESIRERRAGAEEAKLKAKQGKKKKMQVNTLINQVPSREFFSLPNESGHGRKSSTEKRNSLRIFLKSLLNIEISCCTLFTRRKSSSKLKIKLDLRSPS